MSPVVRIPPSPTGFMHLGTARVALYNHLFAKKNKGKIVFRFEDTDKERSKKEFEGGMLESLSWLGITYDNEPERQSERGHIYRPYLEKLLRENKAYESEEDSKERPGERVKIIRLKNPGEIITFTDLVRGDISFNTKELGDFVIAKNLDYSLYHFAVVVDDHEMGITHIIRGEDHISNTPRQILIQRAIGASMPQYAHVPLILAPDRSKLSKRHGSVSVTEYKNQGFLPEALINYLALLGWNPGTSQEIFSLSELVEQFSLEGIQKSGAIFDIKKLEWFNREHLKRMPKEKVIEEILNRLSSITTSLPGFSLEKLTKIYPIVIERVSTLGEISNLEKEGELSYFFASPQVDKVHLVWKESTPDMARLHLKYVKNIFEKLDEKSFSNPENIKGAILPYAEQEGRGEVLWPLRYSLSGKLKSPDPFTISSLLGKEESIKRIEGAYTILE